MAIRSSAIPRQRGFVNIRMSIGWATGNTASALESLTTPHYRKTRTAQFRHSCMQDRRKSQYTCLRRRNRLRTAASRYLPNSATRPRTSRNSVAPCRVAHRTRVPRLKNPIQSRRSPFRFRFPQVSAPRHHPPSSSLRRTPPERRSQQCKRTDERSCRPPFSPS